MRSTSLPWGFTWSQGQSSNSYSTLRSTRRRRTIRVKNVSNASPTAFSSTVNEHHGFWLYRFEKEGVYDLFCAPHKWGGMGMRIVVGDDPGGVVRAPGRPSLPMTAALLGTGLGGDIGHPDLEPQNIIDNGPISGHDLDIDLEVTITAPSPT